MAQDDFEDEFDRTLRQDNEMKATAYYKAISAKHWADFSAPAKPLIEDIERAVTHVLSGAVGTRP